MKVEGFTTGQAEGLIGGRCTKCGGELYMTGYPEFEAALFKSAEGTQGKKVRIAGTLLVRCDGRWCDAAFMLDLVLVGAEECGA